MACGEAIKVELRVLVEQLQLKFLDVEGTIRTLIATAATAASTVPSREDPWFQPGQSAPQAAASERTAATFRIDVDSDDGVAPVLGFPGIQQQQQQQQSTYAQSFQQQQRSLPATPEFRVDLLN